MSGFFLNIDGIDCSGKSTHINYIKTWMQKHFISAVITREPGGTKIGESLRNILLEEDTDISIETETLLMFASRQQHLKEIILPAIVQNKCVITDRFTTSTYAYQGAGKGLSFNKIKILENWIKDYKYPDFNIIFDIPMELFLFRKSRLVGDRFENEDVKFFKKVKDFYLGLAKNNNDKYIVIDSSKDIDIVQKEIEYILFEKLKNKYCL